MSDRQPFSVLMCVYAKDNPEHFRQALESIIDQTVKPDEIVLVMDGPVTKAIKHVVKTYEGASFFKVIRLLENVGHGNARRIGLENCSNNLIAIMDADDLSVPDRFERQMKCFENDKDLSIVGGNIKEFIDSIDHIVGFRKVPAEDADIKKYLKKRCPFNQMTVMFKYSDVMKAGGYIDWFCDEDYYLWIRMYECGSKFKNIPDNLVFVRVGNGMYRRRGGLKYFQSESKLQIYMLNSGIIDILTYMNNILFRFILQILVPSKIRGLIYKSFAREKC